MPAPSRARSRRSPATARSPICALSAFATWQRPVPLQSDAIFWIASMTKPVTSVAAMMLVEEGKLDLAAPVTQYLPEFKDTMVAVETRDAGDRQDRHHIRAAEASDDRRGPAAPYRRASSMASARRRWISCTASISTPKPACFTATGLCADVVSELARLPLAHQPGEVWDYGHSLDVLGRVIEVASGQPLDQFLESRLFKPLGMIDTGFYVPRSQAIPPGRSARR